MRLYDIIKKPIITEKSTLLEVDWMYLVEISSDATKIDVKKAFLEIYKVEVSDVNVLNTREKFKNWRKWPQIKRRTTKRAYVTLKNKADKIDFSSVK